MGLSHGVWPRIRALDVRVSSIADLSPRNYQLFSACSEREIEVQTDVNNRGKGCGHFVSANARWIGVVR